MLMHVHTLSKTKAKCSALPYTVPVYAAPHAYSLPSSDHGLGCDDTKQAPGKHRRMLNSSGLNLVEMFRRNWKKFESSILAAVYFGGLLTVCPIAQKFEGLEAIFQLCIFRPISKHMHWDVALPRNRRSDVENVSFAPFVRLEIVVAIHVKGTSEAACAPEVMNAQLCLKLSNNRPFGSLKLCQFKKSCFKCRKLNRPNSYC